MNSKNIDDQIRDYYASQDPAPHTVARLKQGMRTSAPLRPRRRIWIAVAAVVAIAFSTFLWTTSHRMETPQQVATVVARQAAYGHNERRELDFRSDDSAQLRREMKSLDFALVEPEMMREMKMHVIGARYATLAGAIAAQIVYVDSKGIPCTLYESRPVGELARIATGDHVVDGLRVSVWKEKGLVMVLARPMA